MEKSPGAVPGTNTGPLCPQLFEFPVWMLDVGEFFLHSRPLFGLVNGPLIFFSSQLFDSCLFGGIYFECICLLASDLSVLQLLQHLTVTFLTFLSFPATLPF